MDNSLSAVRRRRLLDIVSKCDNDDDRIRILVDRIISLEDSFNELQNVYSELLLKFKNFQCVPDQF